MINLPKDNGAVLAIATVGALSALGLFAGGAARGSRGRKSFYDVLGITQDATPEEIKLAWRTTAKATHPDLYPGDKEKQKRFKAAREAYDVLSDYDKRKISGPVRLPKKQTMRKRLNMVRKANLWRIAVEMRLVKERRGEDWRKHWTKSEIVGMIIAHKYPGKGSAKRTKWGTKSHALSKTKRASLSARDFALPKQRKYPIYDKKHGQLALTYATWSKTSRKDLPKVKRAVFARYPSLRRWWNSTDYVQQHPKQRARISRRAA